LSAVRVDIWQHFSPFPGFSLPDNHEIINLRMPMWISGKAR
jgi:hypothetical protein